MNRNNNPWKNTSWCVLYLTLAILQAGCAGESSGSGRPVAVSGTVTVGDQPLPFGIVEFQAEDNEKLVRTAKVKVGQFSLDDRSGLVDGDYSVRILPYDLEVEELPQVNPEERRSINAARALIPEKYQKVGAFRSTLSADRPNSLKFELSNTGRTQGG